MKTSDIPEDVQAEMDGKGAEPMTFAAWMNAKTVEEQNALFGSLNASRWRAGNITLTELVRQSGRALSVSEFLAGTG